MINPSTKLGLLNGPVLLFGGPYSNLAATEAMQAEAQRLQIPPERVICTGDIIAYCADPVETLELIMHWGIHVVQGNCEQSLGAGAPNCGCGFDTGSNCSLLSIEWYKYASQRVSAKHKHWMAQLPGQLDFQLGNFKFNVVHGSNDRINEFIFPGTPKAVKQARLSATTADVVVGGHCGIPFGERIDRQYWLNAGVIGMPANDGTPDGWYLLLEPHDDCVVAYWHRLPYHVQQSLQRMQKAQLCDAYAQALTTGRWPSIDILPKTDQLQTNTPLRVQPIRVTPLR